MNILNKFKKNNEVNYCIIKAPINHLTELQLGISYHGQTSQGDVRYV